MTAVAAPAAAQAGDDFELPPEPDDLPPSLAGTVFFPGFLPLVVDHVCPADAACVFGGGGGIGGSIERRWPMGFAIGLEYEAWFLNSNGIYELGVMQALKAYVRYLFLRDNAVHPSIAAGIGGVIFGDTLKVATVGLAVDLIAGMEWELSETVAFTVGLAARFFSLDTFVADRVTRGEGFGVDVTLGLRAGFVIYETP